VCAALALRKSADQVIYDEHYDSADNRDEHAPQIEAGYAGPAEPLEEPAANDAADNTKEDVEEETFTLPVHDLAGDEARDQPEHDPADD
jgi:hypothetical protein